MKSDLLLPLLPFLLSLPQTHAADRPKNAILLSTVQSLTLRDGRKTTHRRVSAIPQLKCIASPDLCAIHTIDVMRCTNQGSSYSDEDIQWSCVASLPEDLKLGSTDVICEGYSSPDDPYILKGSCGVEYRVTLTEIGEQRYPELGKGKGSGSWFGFKPDKQSKGKNNDHDFSAWRKDTGSKSSMASYLFFLIFAGLLTWIIRSAWTQANTRGPPRVGFGNRGDGGGGGGGGGGGWGSGWGSGWGPGHDPPPPYPGTGTKPQSGTGWQPGFWTGLAGGAAAAYMAGNRNSRNRDRVYGDDYRRGGFGESSGWASSSRPSTRSSTASSDSARYNSTGFGGTSRR